MPTDIGATSEFPEGEMRIVEVDRREIGVICWDGRYYAVRNGCPHQNAPLCRGTMRLPLTSANVGEMQVADPRPVITCPWHGWAFDLVSGESTTGDRGRVRAYTVTTEGGRVLLETTRRPRGE